MVVRAGTVDGCDWMCAALVDVAFAVDRIRGRFAVGARLAKFAGLAHSRSVTFAATSRPALGAAEHALATLEMIVANGEFSLRYGRADVAAAADRIGSVLTHVAWLAEVARSAGRHHSIFAVTGPTFGTAEMTLAAFPVPVT